MIVFRSLSNSIDSIFVLKKKTWKVDFVLCHCSLFVSNIKTLLKRCTYSAWLEENFWKHKVRLIKLVSLLFCQIWDLNLIFPQFTKKLKYTTGYLFYLHSAKKIIRFRIFVKLFFFSFLCFCSFSLLSSAQVSQWIQLIIGDTSLQPQILLNLKFLFHSLQTLQLRTTFRYD